MRISSTLLAFVGVSVASPLMAQQYPPPPDPAAAQLGYDRLEQLLWEGATRKNTPDAYQTYLHRYPDGPHSDQARGALARLGVPPVPADQPPAPYPQPPAYPAPDPRGYPAPGAPAYPQTQPPAPPPPSAYAPPPAPSPVQTSAPPLPEPAAPPVAAPAEAPAPVAAAPAGSPLFLCRPVFPGGGAPFEKAGEAELGAYLEAIKINSLAAYKAYLQAYPHGAFAPAVAELIATREGRAKAFAAMPVPGPRQAHARTPVTVGPGDFEGPAPAAATAIWEVAEDGCVQSCRIEKSSGSPGFDAAACRVLSARGSYEPARDASGKPIPSIDSGSFGRGPGR